GGHLVTHALTAEGFDASEDGTGRGTPLIAGRGPRPPADPDGVRAPSGISGRLDVGAVKSIMENEKGEVFEADYTQPLGVAGGKAGQGYAAVRLARPLDAGSTCAFDPTPDGRRYAAC